MTYNFQKDQQSPLERRALEAEHETAALREENSKLQSELSIASSRAGAAESLKRQFLANISHEVRTPMNGILGMTELLLGTKLNENQRKFANSIAHSTESLLFVVNDMLDLSSLHQGTVDLEDNEFIFSKTVKKVCERHQDKAKTKSIKLTCSVSDIDQLPVIGDEFRIQQIISNLVDNAIKFTDTGEIQITENSNPDQGSYSVSVKDSGAGIHPDVQSHIFNSFSQGDGSTTRKYGGCGLGLPIANRLAQLMNGEISMQSEYGQGSTFTFSCKLKQGNKENINELGKNILQGTRVLIVDDIETNLEILSLQLQQWDLEVQCADSGATALKLLEAAEKQSNPFQLAILDLNMPNMDGLELAQHIQNANFSKQMRLMMLSSSVIDLKSEELKQRGIVRSMMKPARQALLYDCIKNIIEKPDEIVCMPAPARTTRILLTEDDPINQEVATTMLESMDYEVIVADNGAEAVEILLQDKNIDLVLMDCQMPVMDGFDATKAIRHNGIKTPIIALTANAMQGDRDLCLEAGMDDYITKPIYQNDLLKIVELWASKVAVESGDSANQIDGSKDNNSVPSDQSEYTLDIQIDETALNAIRSLQRPGKPDILARIVNMYMDKSPDLIAAIQEGVAANDCDKVKIAAHTLKSSSAYVGASSVAEACSRVEASAAGNDLGDTAEDLQHISLGFNAVVDQIKQYA